RTTSPRRRWKRGGPSARAYPCRTLIPSRLCVNRKSPLPAHTALGTSHSRHAPPHAVDGFLHDVARQASALSMLREVSLQALNQVGDDRGAMPRSVRHMEPLPRRWAIQPRAGEPRRENLSWFSRGRLSWSGRLPFLDGRPGAGREVDDVALRGSAGERRREHLVVGEPALPVPG